MKDTLGKEISADDTIAVCRSKGTNSSLVVGKVDRVHEKSVDYIVIHPGEYFGGSGRYSNSLSTGDIAYATQSHRVLIVEKS